VFYDDYYARVDADLADLKLQDDEVDEALWMTVDEIRDAIKNGDFLENHVEEFERLLAWLKS
jgi:NADH pyrophosphatase NudC (nudix superfamily)